MQQPPLTYNTPSSLKYKMVVIQRFWWCLDDFVSKVDQLVPQEKENYKPCYPGSFYEEMSMGTTR